MKDEPFRSYRGGNWEAFDDFYFFHLASRHSLYPEYPLVNGGVRLVVEVE